MARSDFRLAETPDRILAPQLPEPPKREPYTPPPEIPNRVPDTPAKSKSTRTPSFQAATHEKRREIVCTAFLPSTREVDLLWFRDFLLPSLPIDMKVTDALRVLRVRGIIQAGRFKHFPVDPSAVRLKRLKGCKKTREERIFALLEPLFQEIVSAGSSLSTMKPILAFCMNPSAVPTSQNRRNDTRPDGYGILTARAASKVRAKTRPAWSTIALAEEVKRINNARTRYDVSVIDSILILPSDSCGIIRITPKSCGVFIMYWPTIPLGGSCLLSPSRITK